MTEKIEPPSLFAGCASNNDCPDYTACENRKCINPCAEKDPCARNAYCKVIRHKPVCTCPDGYIGDPTTSCELRKYNFICQWVTVVKRNYYSNNIKLNTKKILKSG